MRESDSQKPSTFERLEPRQLLSAPISEYQLPTGSYPDKVIKGLDGSIYVYEQNADSLARLRPHSTTFTQIPTGTAGDSHFGMVLSKAGDVFFTVHNGIGAYSPKFNRVTIVPLGFSPNDIAPGPDGNLWFTVPDGNSVGRLTLAKSGQFVINPTVSTFVVPYFTNTNIPAGAASITIGPKNDLWFGEDLADQVGQITFSKTKVPTITEYPLPTANAHPVGITAGPDGNVWFAEVFGNKIGRINEKTKVVTEFTNIRANSEPFWITTGPDKALWFTERAGDHLGRITTAGVITETSATPGDFLTSIAAGPNKTLFFTESNSDAVGVWPYFTRVSAT